MSGGFIDARVEAFSSSGFFRIIFHLAMGRQALGHAEIRMVFRASGVRWRWRVLVPWKWDIHILQIRAVWNICALQREVNGLASASELLESDVVEFIHFGPGVAIIALGSFH